MSDSHHPFFDFEGNLEYDEDLEQQFFVKFEPLPEIDEFLKWSEENEGYRFRTLSLGGGLEFVFSAQSAFEAIGVGGGDLASSVDGNPRAIRRVCRLVLRHLHEMGVRADQGETQQVSRNLKISPALVRGYILASLDGMERYDRYQPIPELHYLLKLMLLPGIPAFEKNRIASNRKFKTLFRAAEIYHRTGSVPGMRECAKLFNIAASTISRMFDSHEDYEIEVIETYLRFKEYDEDYWTNLFGNPSTE